MTINSLSTVDNYAAACLRGPTSESKIALETALSNLHEQLGTVTIGEVEEWNDFIRMQNDLSGLNRVLTTFFDAPVTGTTYMLTRPSSNYAEYAQKVQNVVQKHRPLIERSLQCLARRAHVAAMNTSTLQKASPAVAPTTTPPSPSTAQPSAHFHQSPSSAFSSVSSSSSSSSAAAAVAIPRSIAQEINEFDRSNSGKITWGDSAFEQRVRKCIAEAATPLSTPSSSSSSASSVKNLPHFPEAVKNVITYIDDSLFSRIPDGLLGGVVDELVSFARRECGYLPHPSICEYFRELSKAASAPMLNPFSSTQPLSSPHHVYGCRVNGFYAMTDRASLEMRSNNIEPIAYDNEANTETSSFAKLVQSLEGKTCNPGDTIMVVTTRPWHFISDFETLAERGFKFLLVYDSENGTATSTEIAALEQMFKKIGDRMLRTLDFQLLLKRLVPAPAPTTDSSSSSSSSSTSQPKKSEIPACLITKSEQVLASPLLSSLWKTLCLAAKRDSRRHALIYIDWANIQVPLVYIPALVNGLLRSTKDENNCVQKVRRLVAFSDRLRDPLEVEQLINANVEIVHIASIDKEKTNQIIAERIFVTNNLRPSDAIVMVSGDSARSPLMARLSQLGHGVFSVHNSGQMAFNQNLQWDASSNYLDLDELSHLKEGIERRMERGEFQRQVLQ